MAHRSNPTCSDTRSGYGDFLQALKRAVTEARNYNNAAAKAPGYASGIIYNPTGSCGSGKGDRSVRLLG